MMDLGLDLSVAALAVGITGVMYAALGQAGARHARAQAGQQVEFDTARANLKRHRGALAGAALRHHGDYQFDKEIPLLTAPGWIPRNPLQFGNVRLTMSQPDADQVENLHRARDKLLAYWPPGSDGRHLPTYSKSILERDRLTRMEDRPSYRLLGVRADPSGLGQALDFARATYFDGIDTEEALAYETALLELRKGGPPAAGGPYRKWLADPFDLSRRAAMPGINTLTVRLSKSGPRFFMHRRGTEAGLSMGVYHVAPAGEFQPQIDDPTVWYSDLDMMHNIIREYAEEYLGIPEADGRGGTTIDYERHDPYRKLLRAYRTSRMRAFYLGIGLDPLSWKPEILTTCLFDERTFDEIFADMVTDKIDEGTGGVLLVGKTRTTAGRTLRMYTGIDFTAENVASYTDLASTLPAGIACLNLTTRWLQSRLI